MKVLLVTGGAGFVGSNFIKYFLKRNKNFFVINMDKLIFSSNLDNLRELEDSPRHQFIKGDICNQDLLNFVLNKYKPDYIMNFASESYTERNILSPCSFGQTNVMGTLYLLEGAKNLWHKNKYNNNRFIQISTDEVYGSLSNKTDYSNEESSLAPNNPYSASKASADLLCQSFNSTYGIPTIISRSCNIYGPHQHHERFIPKCIISAIEDGQFPLYGEGSNIREWLHVNDHSIALIRTLFYGSSGQIYNIGSGQEISNVDLAREILKIMKKSDDLIRKIPDSPSKEYRYAMNSYKIRNNLGWSSKISLEEGIKDTIRWYLTNKDTWTHK